MAMAPQKTPSKRARYVTYHDQGWGYKKTAKSSVHPSTEAELCQQSLSAWDEIDMKMVNLEVASMEERRKELIKAKGMQTSFKHVRHPSSTSLQVSSYVHMHMME